MSERRAANMRNISTIREVEELLLLLRERLGGLKACQLIAAKLG
jgi:hypothetical protein